MTRRRPRASCWRALLIVALSTFPRVSGAEPGPASQPTASAPAASQPLVRESASHPPTTKLLAGHQQRLEALERRLAQQEKRSTSLREELDAVAGEAGASLERTFSISGFFDLSFRKVWVPGQVIAEDLIPQQPAFVFGHLNLYFDFNPHPSWRVLTEARLLLNPLGDTESFENEATGEPYRRVDVTTEDYAHYGSEFEYGAVAIERAHVEWRRFEWLGVTAGLFLTPFGIWNIDHGSPAQVRGAQPTVYANYDMASSFFPRRQLGLQLSGRLAVRELGVEYALTLTNGDGPVQTLYDADKDKALGGRVALEYDGGWRGKLGVSAYTGGYSDFKMVLQTTPTLDYLQEITVQQRQTSLGIDLKLEAGPFTLSSELLVSWHRYRDGRRPPAQAIGAPGSGSAPDWRSLGGYAQLAYRLPIDSVNLLTFVEFGYVDRIDLLDTDDLIELTGGVNWRIVPSVVLKLELSTFHWLSPPTGQRSVFSGIGSMYGLQSQLAVAF